MKITSISCSMTRQVQQFQPASFTMQAELQTGEDPKECARELQRLVIRVLYRDSPKLQEPLFAMIDSDRGQKAAPIKSAIGNVKLEEPQF